MNDNYEMEFLLEDLKGYGISYLSRIMKARYMLKEGDTYGAYNVALEALCRMRITALESMSELNRALVSEEGKERK